MPSFDGFLEASPDSSRLSNRPKTTGELQAAGRSRTATAIRGKKHGRLTQPKGSCIIRPPYRLRFRAGATPLDRMPGSERIGNQHRPPRGFNAGGKGCLPGLRSSKSRGTAATLPCTGYLVKGLKAVNWLAVRDGGDRHPSGPNVSSSYTE